ncbi:MAG: hypothetical protein QM652_00595 [Legionella sp.]|uniref:hypothetical protein n=1 Tax=Legionella sp. TaxID=459 RepID=UPI0039E6BA5F
MMTATQAATPLWTLTPLTQTTYSIPNNGMITIQYRVTNQSPRTHTLTMIPINGVNQITSTGNCPLAFTLYFKQSCILTLQIVGSTLTSNITGGPKIGQHANLLQCYQPSIINRLNITKTPILNTYTYITNANNNSLIKCTLDPINGTLIDCIDSGAYGLGTPFGISIHPIIKNNLHC